MAITLTGTPAKVREGDTVNVFTASNKLLFEFTAGAGETSLQVQVQDDASNVLGTLKTLPFSTANTLTVDVGFILRNQLNNDDDSSNLMGLLASTGTGSTKPFKIAYRVAGTGAYTVLSTTYQAIRGVRQNGSTYGATIAEYVPIFTGTTIDFTGQWLTRFETPVLFWWSDRANPTTAQASFWQCQTAFATQAGDIGKIDTIRQLNYSGATLLDTTDSVITTTTPVTTFGIDDVQEKIAYTHTVISAGINAGAGVVNTAIEPITFEIRRACKNPTALKWLNTLGTWETWVFEGRTPYNIETDSQGGEYGIYQADISTAAETRRYLSKNAFKTVSVFADNLTLDQVRAISEIYYSPHVIMFVGELVAGATFDDWQGATIDTGSFAVEDTYNSKHKISFDIKMIDILTISN
jgi:hypothetical protein